MRHAGLMFIHPVMCSSFPEFARKRGKSGGQVSRFQILEKELATSPLSQLN